MCTVYCTIHVHKEIYFINIEKDESPNYNLSPKLFQHEVYMKNLFFVA